ncbi:MAG: hypothetical protein ACOC0U_04995 [Desulfovibrionales bacterium]
MASPINLSVLLSQLPLLQKVQSVQQNHPESFQGQVAQEILLKQKEKSTQVPRPEKADSSPKVGPDGKNPDGGQHSGGRKDDRSDQENQEDLGGNDPGRIIDLKI